MNSTQHCNHAWIKHVYCSCVRIRRVPRKVLKSRAWRRGFQHFLRDTANVDTKVHSVTCTANRVTWDLYRFSTLYITGLVFAKTRNFHHSVVFLRSFCTERPRSSAIFKRETTLVTYCFASLFATLPPSSPPTPPPPPTHIHIYLEGIISLRVDPFLEKKQNIFDRISAPG